MSLSVLMTVDAVGGVWRYAMDLGAALSQRGCRMIFAGLGPRPSPGQAAEATAAGMLVWGEAPLDWAVRDAAALAPVAPWLDMLVRMHRPDILHLNLPSQAAQLQTDLPVVAVCHSCLATWFAAVDGGPPPADLAWHGRLVRDGLARAQVAVAPTRAHAAATAAAYGTAAPRVVPNASAVPPHPSAGGAGAIALGRWWDRGKNGAVLVAAARLSRVPITLIGATEAPDGQRLDARPARAAGPLRHAAALERLAKAALFVSPSLYEPFGLATLEAARLGRPLILSDIPTYRELWAGAAAFFDPHDPEALATMIDRLDQDPDERRRLGAAAQERAAGYIPARQAEAMLAVYARLGAVRAAV